MLSNIEYFGKSSNYPQAKDTIISKRIVFEERLIISALKPDIEYLESIKIGPFFGRNQILENVLGKLLFLQGEIDLELIYQSNTREICTSNFKFSFCTFLEMPNFLSDDRYNAEILVEYIDLRMINAREVSASLLALIWLPQIKENYLEYQANYPYKIKIYRAQKYRVS
jgi:hypothetical protein